MKIKVFCAVILLSAITAAAQNPSKILRQAEKALGGTKQLQSIRSIIRTGLVTRVGDGADGKYLLQSAQPNFLSYAYDLNGVETELGYNGRSGWLRRSSEGLSTLTGKSFTALQAKAQFRNNLWLNAKKEKVRITSGGETTIDGKKTAVVVMTSPKGITVKMYFDAATALPVRDEIQSGDTFEQTDYDDYRSVGGTKQAFFNRITNDGQVLEIRFTDIRINPEISQAKFDFPKLSGDPLPDIPALLTQLQTNEDRIEDLLESYSFIQKSIHRELGKDGVLREKESETFQMSFYKGFRIARLIEKNGKPLSESEQADQDKQAAKRVEEIDKTIAKRQSDKENEEEDGRRISIAEMLRASKLLNPRRERFRGRDVIVFDFEPNPAFDYKNAKSMLKFFGKTAGVMWIDEKDKQVARVDAYLADSFNIGGGLVAKLKKGATFTLEQERVNDEIWLPSLADINLSVRVFLVKGSDLNQVIRSYDYRKFTTEVKDAKVNSAKEQ